MHPTPQQSGTLSALATTWPPNAQASVPTSFIRRGVVAAAVVLAAAIVHDAPSAFGSYEQRMLASNTALAPVGMTTRPSSVVIIATQQSLFRRDNCELQENKINRGPTSIQITDRIS